MPGHTGHNTRPHAQFPGYGCMDDLTTENSFNSQATWVIMSLIYLLDPGCLYNQALADVRSTGAGIRCVYCTMLSMGNTYLAPSDAKVINKSDSKS